MQIVLRPLLVLLAVLAVAPPARADLNPILRWLRDRLPLAEINHKVVLPTPSVNDRRIGKSGSSPMALRIVVDRNSTGFPAGIGKIVHDSLFPNYPGFTFKVLFAAA